MNKILALSLTCLIGYFSSLWFEAVLIDAVPLEQVQVHIQKRDTMSVGMRRCKVHYDALRMQSYLSCMNRVKSI